MRLFFLPFLYVLIASSCRVAGGNEGRTLSSPKDSLRLWYTAPAKTWVEALPLGNGRLGAMVFGGTAEERLQFNEETLWTGRPRDYHREGAARHLPRIRKLLFEGKQEAAEELAQQVFMGKMINEDNYDSLKKAWLEKVLVPEEMGGDPSAAGYDDRSWKEMHVPADDGWRSGGLEGVNGAVWFRYTFRLPPDWKGKDLVLELGRIRDKDITYVNGKKVGSLEGKDLNRTYRLPAQLLVPGENVIAIQVLSFFDKGGFTGFDDSEEPLSVYPQGEKERHLIILSKAWKYKVQNAAPPEFPDYMARYQPFGDLKIRFRHSGNVTSYRRALDISRAVASTSYEADGVRYRREYLASAPDQVIAVHLTAGKPGKISFEAALSTPHPLSSTRRVDDHTLALSLRIRDGALKGESYLAVKAAGGRVTVTDNGITVEEADSVSLFLAAATNFKNFKDVSGNPAAACKKTLQRLEKKDYQALKAAHIREYRKFFDTFSIRLGEAAAAAASAVTDAAPGVPGTRPAAPGSLPTDERLKAFEPGNDPALAALYLQYARYLLISSSRPGTRPANLQGIWNHLMLPPWDSKYTTNINLEMNYWPAEVLHLSRCHEPLFQLIEEVAENGRKTAKAHYGCRGWVLHHNTDIWRGTAPVNASNHGIWVGGGAWLCHHLWEHYRYTLDKDFLEDRAYPLMKGAALFYVDFLVEDPKTGWLISTPSNSPELGGLVAGPAMDHQLIRDLFRNCIRASRLLDVDADLRNVLEEKLAKIAPDQVGRHGQLQEWLEDKDDPDEKHRHVSHLWGVHPGHEITWDKNPELMKAARQSLIFRGDGGTGWSLAWKVNLWARFKDGNHAHQMLAHLLQPAIDASGEERGGTYPNLFDAHPPFQIDGNFGGAAGIAEMLMQSQNGYIELLPALPEAWPSGEVKGLRARGGFTLNFRWKNGQLQELTLLSNAGGTCELRYGDKKVTLETEKGNTYRFSGKLEQL